MSLFEILDMEDQTLISAIKRNLEDFSALRKIYDEKTISYLVKKKSYDNYLLWLLVSNKEYAHIARKEIENQIGFVSEENNFETLEQTLRRNYDKRVEHTLTILDLTSLFKKNGFSVTFEPTLEETRVRPDFEVRNEHRVFFEIKTMFESNIIRKLDKKDIHIQMGLKKIQTSFVYSLSYTKEFEKIDVRDFLSFIQRNFTDIEDLEEFPPKISYPDDQHELIKIFLHEKTPEKEGYLAGISTPVFEMKNSKRIRDRIKRSARQLPRETANIVVIDVSNSPFIDFDDLFAALFGDLVITLDIPSGRLLPKRDMQRAFGKYNTRLSAVVFYERKHEFSKKVFKRRIQVIENNAAETRAPSEILSVLLEKGDA